MKVSGIAACVVLLVSACLAGAACSCSGNGGNGGDAGPEVTEVKDLLGEDIGGDPDGEPGDLVELDEVAPPPDEVTHDVELEGDAPPDEVDADLDGKDEAETGPSCDLECTYDDDCAGKFSGSPICEECRKEYCAPSPECEEAGFGKNQCQVMQKSGCCCEDPECEDGNPCTIKHKCVNNKCESEKDVNNPDCCFDTVIREINFDQAAQFSDIPPAILKLNQDYKEDDCAMPTVTEGPCGGKMLYLGCQNKDGQEGCNTYFTGQIGPNCTNIEKMPCTPATEDTDCPPPAKCGPNGKCVPDPLADRVWIELEVPELNLPAAKNIAFQLDVWGAVEPPLPPPSFPFDQLEIEVVVGGMPQEIIYSTQDDANPKCKKVVADLSAYAGMSISLIIRFDTFDDNNNFFEGFYLDNIRVVTFCKSCKKAEDCKDTDPCTDDVCLLFWNDESGEGYCANTQEPGEVCCYDAEGKDDPAVCVTASQYQDEVCWPSCCISGKCVWSPNPSCCTQDMLAEYFLEGFAAGTVPAGWDQPATDLSTVWYVKANAGAPGDPDGNALVFGNPATGTYNCGQDWCKGSVTTSEIDLTQAKPEAYVRLSFLLKLQTEFNDPTSYPEGNASSLMPLDLLALHAIGPNGIETMIWSSDNVFGSTQGAWLEQWADLTPYKGGQVKLRFYFTTGDATPPNNDFAGPWIDQLKVETVCDAVCSIDKDCSAGICQTAACEGGKCAFAPVPDCCDVGINELCDDKDECTEDSCKLSGKPGEPGTCLHVNTGEPGCCTPKDPVYVQSFEGEMTWTLLGDEGLNECGNGVCQDEIGETELTCPSDCNAAVKWQVTDHKFCSGAKSLYFGNPEKWTYANGNKQVKGTIASSPIEMPPYGIPIISFCLFLDTEHTFAWETWVGQWLEDGAQIDWDKLIVYVQTSDTLDNPVWSPKQPVWDSFAWETKGSTWDSDVEALQWATVELGLKDLSLSGKVVRFLFEFDSKDGSANEFEGVYVDNFKVRTICDPESSYVCFSSVECPEGTPADPNCTIETCLNNACGYVPNDKADGCCQPQLIKGYDFDTPNCGMNGWQTDQPANQYKWQADNSQKKSGTCSMYFGKPKDHTYAPPNAGSNGRAVSQPVHLTKDQSKVTVHFWTWMDVEDPNYFLDYTALQLNYSIFEASGLVLLPAEESQVEVWRKPCSADKDPECQTVPLEFPCSGPPFECVNMPAKTWVEHSVLIDFTKEPYDKVWVDFQDDHYITFVFYFAADDDHNQGVGVFVDDFAVKTTCQ